MQWEDVPGGGAMTALHLGEEHRKLREARREAYRRRIELEEGKHTTRGGIMGKAEQMNAANAALADRLRPMVREAKEELEAAGAALLEAQARRDAALDNYRKLSARLYEAETNAHKTPLSVGY
jgi:hypothetical protein